MSEAEFKTSEELRRLAERKVNVVKGKQLEQLEKDSPGVDESQLIAGEVYGLIKPLVEMKRRQVVAEQELQADINSLTNSLNLVTEQLKRVTAKMDELVKSRSVNAEKENKALDGLLAIL